MSLYVVGCEWEVEVDIVDAWKAEVMLMKGAFDCSLFHDTLDRNHDLIVILDLLDLVRAGENKQHLYCHRVRHGQVLTIPAMQGRNSSGQL